MPVHTLTDTFDRLDIGWSRTTPATFVEVLSDILIEPVVGSPLPFDEVSLPDPPINLDPTPTQIDRARTGVTAVELAVADYGSVVIRQRDDRTEAVSLFPQLHVAILRESDIVPDLGAALDWMRETITGGAAGAVLATGSSATADMGALVRGAHGPEQVHVIILSDL